MSELTEKEQIEEIRKWWGENGRFIITGLVLGVGALFGWRYYQAHKIQRAEAASAIFEQLLNATRVGNLDVAAPLAAQLTDSYASSPYAIQARLALAKLHVENDQYPEAAGVLRDALAKADDNWAHVVRLRLARVQLAQGDADTAIATLAAAEAGTFNAQYEELRGDALFHKGELQAARRAWQKVVDEALPGIDTSYVQIKLDALPEASPAS